MNSYFWVKWVDAKRCEHIVGLLYHTNGMYHFRYNKEFQDEASIPKGFNGVPSFGKLIGLDNVKLKKRVLHVHSCHDLFPFFKMRIAKETDEYIWKAYGIINYSPTLLLTITKAIIPTDSFLVEEMDQDAISELAKEYLE